MRKLAIALFVLCAASLQAQEVLTSDTPRTTVAGNAFIAPAGWKITVRDQATILESPEGNSHIALVDVKAPDAETAVKTAWAQYGVEPKWPLLNVNEFADKDGWTSVRVYNYETSPNEKRVVQVATRRANDIWTVAVVDLDQAVAEKRGAQMSLIFGRLLPKGYSRESFAGKKAHKLDAERLAQLEKFIDDGRRQLRVPGVSIGIVEDGKVLFAGGFGQKDIASPAKPDGDTLYMIASNTKQLTTLMLAKLVDEGKLTWTTPVTSVMPGFKLGDADTTKQVLIKHLICACTGLPRQDFEWLFQFAGGTPETIMATLATMQPTTRFGELFQYSNPLAAAAGYVGGHVAYPELELGAAYDRAMETRVFGPLRMTHTTFDFKKALAGNHATAHSADLDGNPAHGVFDLDYSAIPIRPAGAAWSSVNDMLRYVRMELSEGVLPTGRRYISKEPLLARRAPQVSIGKDVTYGMGLIVDTTWGVPVVHHGGDLLGYHSDVIWYPQQNVGAVILTNADAGSRLRGPFLRRILEVMFDGRPQAQADLDTAAKRYFDDLATFKKQLTVPADAVEVGKLAPSYTSGPLGDVIVTHPDGRTLFDFGEWKSDVATRREHDGSVTFVTISPGVAGFEFTPGTNGSKRTLTIRDAQHEYVLTER